MLATVEAEHFPELTDEELLFTRDESETNCAEVRKASSRPPGSRQAFVPRGAIALRKNRKVQRKTSIAVRIPEWLSHPEFPAAILHRLCTHRPPDCTV